MTKLKTALKNGASPYAHLASIPSKPAAKKPADGPAAQAAASVAANAAPGAAVAEAAPASAKAEGGEEAKKTEDEEANKAETSDCDDDEDGEDDKNDGDNEDDENEAKKAKAAGFGKALSAVRRIERRRCAAIFQSKAAAGRIPLACELAFTLHNAMSAKDCTRILAAASPEQPGNAFVRAMADAPRPNVGDGGPKGGADALTPDQRLVAAATARAKDFAAAKKS